MQSAEHCLAPIHPQLRSHGRVALHGSASAVSAAQAQAWHVRKLCWPPATRGATPSKLHQAARLDGMTRLLQPALGGGGGGERGVQPGCAWPQAGQQLVAQTTHALGTRDTQHNAHVTRMQDALASQAAAAALLRHTKENCMQDTCLLRTRKTIHVHSIAILSCGVQVCTHMWDLSWQRALAA